MSEYTQIPQVIKKVLPAVVSITISKYLPVFESPLEPSPFGFEDFFVIPRGKKKMDVGGGSGFIVDPSGVILTNRHVVADPEAEYIVLTNDDKKYTAEILAKDPINDIAIIKIKGENMPTIEMADSSQLELGETVIAIGNTLGIFRNTVSTGVVSGLSRQISTFSNFDHRTMRLRGLIQTDAAINPGNSGGPLLNMDGKAIGVNAAMVFMAENIGFALPINAAKKDLDDIKNYGRIRQPFLGVRYVILNKELQEKYNLPADHGALVIAENIPGGNAVIVGSPADLAGIKETDIILEIGNDKVSLDEPLEDILQKYKVGDEIPLKLLRKGKETISKVILAEKNNL